MIIFIRFIRNLIWGDRTFGVARSGHWPTLRAKFLKENPTCAVCGKRGTLLKPNEIHHIIPVNFDKSKELEFTNLITACRRCHQFVCHLDSWRSANFFIREDSAKILERITNRPK